MQSAAVKTDRPCAFTQAAFSDVPYILDSIWRRAEFEAYRIGRVTTLPPSHRFIIEHTTPWPFFAAYLVISSFVVFGPTFTTLCNSFGLWVAESFRWLLGVLVLLAVLDIVVAVSGEICSRLVRRAAQQWATDQPAPATSERATFAELAEAFGRTADLFTGRLRRRWHKPLTRLRASFAAVARALGAAAPGTKTRLVIAFLLLLIGVGIVTLPFIVAGIRLVSSPFDPHVCSVTPRGLTPVIQGLSQLATFAVLAWIGWVLWSWREPPAARKQLVWITGLWLGAAALMLVVAHGGNREATGGPYPQTYTVLLGCLLLVVFGAQWLAQLVTASVSPQTRSDLQQALASTQLFEGGRTEPELSRLRIVSAIINGVVYHPLHVLLLPALAALMLPTHYLIVWVAVFALIAVMLLAHGSVSSRWEELNLIVQRWFLSGTPLFVSIAVITLALLRLLDVQYVSTLIDAAPVGIISSLILGAYMTLWFVEYWINRWIAEELLGILGAPLRGRTGYVAYPCTASPPGPAVVLPAGRVIALQSLGEFCVQGCLYRSNRAPGEPAYDHAFTIYRLTGLFERLAPGSKATSDVTRRVKAYFATVNVAFVLLALGAVLAHRWGDQPLHAYPVVQVNEAAVPDPAHGADLKSLLEHQAQERRPALIVAASGGGTRAALYTATALQGLAQIDRTRDIVLLSGVSGGGLAVAYFASAYDQLKAPDNPSACAAGLACPWAHFKDLVTEPFIEDVLDGVDELRIAGTVPLGELLGESLERRVFGQVTFGALHEPGLILNTTISGHPWTDSDILNGHVSILRDYDPAVPFASLAGSRLIFTNLTNVDGFPRPPWLMPDVGLDYKVIRDPSVPLAAAAALNANFPPVFSNARVCVGSRTDGNCNGNSYYVTDGGATENLGLVSALYELRGILDSWQHASGSVSGVSAPPPQIDLIVIEASAITYDYTDDRGVGAATGGSKERINGGLTAELIASINERLGGLGAPTLRLHYLPLPVAFRSRGGFGTHWMWADTIRVSNPLVVKLGNRAQQFVDQMTGRPAYAYLDHQDVNTLWDALFDAHTDFCPAHVSGTAATERVAQWVCGCSPRWGIEATPDIQTAAWKQLLSDLGPPGKGSQSAAGGKQPRMRCSR